ncbi:unnamed protein product, partial [Rotaria sp. Silwood2]
MTSNLTHSAFQARQQKLIKIALSSDPVQPYPKPVVTFVENVSSTNVNVGELHVTDITVNELSPVNSHISVISQPQMIVDELPSATPTIKLTSDRSISTPSSILKNRSENVSSKLAAPLKSTGDISPLVPLVGTAILLVIIGASAVFLPPFLLALQTHRDYSCYPGCWNGGSCSAQNVCTCLTGYEGDRCQT